MDNYDKMVEFIEQNNLNGEQVLRLLTDWHGNQLLTNEFLEFVEEEV